VAKGKSDYDCYIKTEFANIPVRSYDAIVVGSGAAGYGCAVSLAQGSVGSGSNIKICIVTEGRLMGTSRNTGSDKQTYYKLSAVADCDDNARAMALNLMAGGSMHGDIAYAEAIGSQRAFYRLVALGVPFPHNEYGEYIGYRTDHDTRSRATSCGPLTSKYMTEALEREATLLGVPLHDGYRVVAIITDSNGEAAGVLAMAKDEATDENPFGLSIFASKNIVYAVGGPSAIYVSTVYPESQTCALGATLIAGARGANLTESQYGIASITPRWNLSGSYQQVLPRYISTDSDGKNEREFLCDYFASAGEYLNAQFLKGYEWPFSPSKVCDKSGRLLSSAVDLAVICEERKGRRVFVDFTRNPTGLMRGCEADISLAGVVACEYLERCGATGGTPISRLARMNPKAIELYRSYGVDLYKEPLEISVCAQHCNGGLEVDMWYETTVPGLFAIGEAAGVFGVSRPGGSALNSTQVGGIRAAEKILSRLRAGNATPPTLAPDDIYRITPDIFLPGRGCILSRDDIMRKRDQYASKMTAAGAVFRRAKDVASALDFVRAEIARFGDYGAGTFDEARELSINRDILLTQFAFLSSISAYIEDGGASRGSYLVTELTPEEILRQRKPIKIDTAHKKFVLSVAMDSRASVAKPIWTPTRPLPKKSEYWFETVWADFENGAIYNR
jgi:succinate dehydrogenase/fumarate reductase flavoprotein subunit